MKRHLIVPALICWAVLNCSTAWAQTNRRAAAPAPKGFCTVADFRMLALSTHDPKERSDKAIAWVNQNGPACTPAQLAMIMSNRPTWMGTGDSFQLATGLERLIEVKSANDPDALERLYRPVVQSPTRRTETALAEPEVPAAAPASAMGAPGGPGADAALAGALGAQAGGGAMAIAPGGQNVSINMAPPPPEVDMSRKMPLPTEPWFSFPPELGMPLLNYFGKIRRQFVKSFYMENLSPGKCPEGMAWRNDRCEPSFPAAWKFGEKIAQGVKTYPVEPKLVEKLNFDPGYTFVRVGGDILALERDTGRIADAVLSLGKV
jgi:hypothetical protein